MLKVTCNVKKLTSSYCTSSSPHTKYFPIQPSHSINKQSLLKPLCRTQSHKNIWPSYSSWKVSKMFSNSHEIQDNHILKMNKTKEKKLNQIHIFTLSNLLIKLLILQKLKIIIHDYHNSREDKVSTSPFMWKVLGTLDKST